MLAFFRRIRKRLIETGAVRKYLLYAIGEIALVVIGILIALQINNWNEERKDKRLATKYIHSLRYEVQSNYEATERLKNWHQQKNEYGQLLVSTLSDDRIVYDNENLFVAVELLGWLYTPDFIQDVWNELYSTGNIQLIRDDSLRSKLTEIYRTINQYTKNVEEWNTYILGYRKIVGQYLPASVRMAFMKHTINRLYTGGFTGYPDMEIMILKLKSRKDLQGLLADMLMTSQGFIIAYLDPLLELYTEILEDLEQPN